MSWSFCLLTIHWIAQFATKVVNVTYKTFLLYMDTHKEE